MQAHVNYSGFGSRSSCKFFGFPVHIKLCLHRIAGFLCGSADKESTYNEEDLGLIPGLGGSPGGGKGNLLSVQPMYLP